jgi:hypothetical protein
LNSPRAEVSVARASPRWELCAHTTIFAGVPLCRPRCPAGRRRLPAAAVPGHRDHLGDQGHPHGTRDILTVGAELSLVGEQTPLVRTMTELGVNAGVVVALSIALVLVRRFARLDRA